MEKKIECEIVQDLLLGYVDNTLNVESKKFVENHLKECKECENRLRDITEDLKDNEDNKEIDYLKNINNNISKKNKFIIIGSIFLIVIIIFNVCVFTNYSKQTSKAEIFLDPGISEEERLNIENKLKKFDNDLEFIYCSKEEHLSDMKNNLGENSYLLNNYEGENNIFPSSYKITAKSSVIRGIQKEISLMSGVKTITSYIDSNPYELYIMNILNKITD